jgi:hypothetical protein
MVVAAHNTSVIQIIFFYHNGVKTYTLISFNEIYVKNWFSVCTKYARFRLLPYRDIKKRPKQTEKDETPDQSMKFTAAFSQKMPSAQRNTKHLLPK